MKLAVVRIRGPMGVRTHVAQALRQMKLTRVNHCVLIENTDANKKLLVTVRDLVAWGEATDEVVAMLEKKGKAPFRLHPPVKGHRPIKTAFPKGALGNNGHKINELLKRML